ncbi:SigB/SigF/SigG family RNA polymerase sigma factor [Gordonia sp. (in: high G+C Gram-positive bacteria)]|uniref:SigB/SigF/SigG family RNA polymerase sigma factor n=1 Tax=Gordonia sp. (in: high G+C Gram-positive bacteria) TaxID=84139 RepID=UPI003F9AEEA6
MTDNEYDQVRTLLARRESLPVDDRHRDRLRDDAVIRCLPLAQHIAQRFSGRGESRDDLLQVARVGLIKAVDRFEPSRDTDFLSFAVPTVTGEVRRHFRDRTALLRTSRRMKELSLRLNEADLRLTHSLRRSPTRRELAVDLGVSAVEIDRARLARAATVSLDRRSGDDDRPMLEKIGHEDLRFDLVDDAQSLRPALARLRARERRILGLRFFADLSQSAIAKQMGLSQMHVSRLLRQSISVLRAELTAAAA